MIAMAKMFCQFPWRLHWLNPTLTLPPFKPYARDVLRGLNVLFCLTTKYTRLLNYAIIVLNRFQLSGMGSGHYYSLRNVV